MTPDDISRHLLTESWIQVFIRFIFALNEKQKPMEIVSIEAKAFEEMNNALNNLIQIAQSRNEPACKGLDEWIDNQDTCILMDISPRKLQTLRCTGAIPYSKIDRKVYYRKADIIQYMESILEKGTSKTDIV